MTTFSEAKIAFDEKYATKKKIDSLVSVKGDMKKDLDIKDVEGKRAEEYYKWQFISSLIDSGLYPKENIGVEVHLPKGNPSAASLEIDGCIFDDKDWLTHYNSYWKGGRTNFTEIDYVKSHIIAVIEFKKDEDEEVEEVYSRQLKPAMESSGNAECLGILYLGEKLYLFRKTTIGGSIRYLRFDKGKNKKGDESTTLSQLSLDKFDYYSYIPSLPELQKQLITCGTVNPAARSVDDLDEITGLNSSQMKAALNQILRVMEGLSLVNQQGYKILIQLIGMKIYDEKNNDPLKFYIEDNEKNWSNLNNQHVQNFVNRMTELHTKAQPKYAKVLQPAIIDWRNKSHVRMICAVVENLQENSFTKKIHDLNQIVFYTFANKFNEVHAGQYLTPLDLIEFLVKIVNPKKGETVLDPTMGTADFLSVSFVEGSEAKDLFGIDNDENMVMMSQLNMLLNGDGDASLEHSPDLGSILYKFKDDNTLVPLEPVQHRDGNWDNWQDYTKLKKFNVVLTNPPFGSGRPFEVKTPTCRSIVELYSLWHVQNANGNLTSIDKGILYLENAVRSLETNGKMGIVLSNSITSVETWQHSREWLGQNMRIVATFSIPPTGFADSTVRTTLVVAYKPKPNELRKLLKNNYEFFSKSINDIGYVPKTENRIRILDPIIKLDDNFKPMIDKEGKEIRKEEFTETIKEFREWIKTQEKKLQELFGN